MFVLNPVSQDRRVLKEASSLRAAGHDVTVIGIQLAKQPRPAEEITPDGVRIVRVPISMAPEPWRPSPRYFTTMRHRIRLARHRLVHRVRRSIAQGRLEIRRRRRRAGIATNSLALRWSRLKRNVRRRRHRAAAQPGFETVRRFRQIASRSRRARSIAAIRVGRFVRHDAVRTRVWHRWVERVRNGDRRWRRRFAQMPASLRTFAGPVIRRVGGGAAEFGRGVGAVLTLPLHAVFTVWAAIYLTANALSGGELDWLLNTRYRWTVFSRRAAAIAPPAAIYHGHDFSAIGAALRARRRHGAGTVIYDSHEVYVEAGTIGKRSPALKAILRFVEGRAYREADALVTVNQMVADVLRDRYGSTPMILVHNCPPRWSPGERWPNLIRDTLRIRDASPIALYQGAFTEVRGLRQMASALLEPGLEHLHLVYLGFGPMQRELLDWQADPKYEGRLHVLAAVHPDDLDRWVASADVSLMPNQPETLNEVVSTPNKLFESIAAGVPVVTSDFPERRRVVLEDPLGPLGAVCDPTDPASIASAILSIVGDTSVGPDRREALRRRCLQAAHERWNWETEAARLLDLYGRFDDRAVISGATVRPA